MTPHLKALARMFGGGTLSSSDGQRFPSKGTSLTARALSRYFADEGLSTYTNVCCRQCLMGMRRREMATVFEHVVAGRGRRSRVAGDDAGGRAQAAG